jgi:uncharacterized protein (DUF736 family)
MPSKEDEVGGIWDRATKDGKAYMSISMNGQSYVAFHNDYKKPGEKSPDWRVYKSQPRDTQASTPRAEQPAPQSSGYAPVQVEDDIPF